MSVKERITDLYIYVTEHSKFHLFKKYFRRLLTFGIIGLIVYQLTDIGWVEVLQSLPSQPLFYIIFAVLFITLPLAEILIYRTVWNADRWPLFKAFVTKKAYNEEVVGYSGEVFLYNWANRNVDSDKIDILKNIRDNSILSAVVSNLVALGLITALVSFDIIELSFIFEYLNLIYVLCGLLLLILIYALVVQFRRFIFDMPFKIARKIFKIYFVRFVIHHFLIIVQWSVVIPDTAFSVWVIFVTIIIIVNRIPLIPSKDLVFMWMGVELSRTLDMATAAVAGMLLVTSVLNKVTNLILYLFFSYRDQIAEKKQDSDY